MSVNVICPAYQSFPMIVPSLLCQTDPGWSLWICHDGPNETYDKFKDFYNDSRICWIHCKERVGNYGHPIRAELLKGELPGRYTLITNHDDYLTPTLIQRINECTTDVVAWNCIHNYWQYDYLPLKLKFGSVDVSSLCVRSDYAKEIGWPNNEVASDYLYVQRVVEKTSDWTFLKGCGLVHN